jgi:hypothetical protein
MVDHSACYKEEIAPLVTDTFDCAGVAKRQIP